MLVGLSSSHQGQEEVLRRAAAGLGTLPVRGLVTSRVTAAGAGVRIKQNASPQKIAAAVRQVLDDPR